MAWINGDWTCDTTNSGYPYITDAGIAAAYDPTNCATVWALRADVLMGYPHILAVFPPDPPAPGMVPRLVSFMLQGLSAGFRQADVAQGLSAPETLPGTFREPPCMTFRFQSEGVIP